jgi:glycosyltransferase involved in cell wall biosynthesis
LPLSIFSSYGKELLDRANKFDFIYIRKAWFIDYDTVRFLSKFKKISPHTKIIMEVPTYPAGREINHWHMVPLFIKDRFCTKNLHKSVDRILTYSNDEIIWGIPTICTCNAINPEQITKRISINKSDKLISLVACSSMAFWHGYDRAIVGLYNYYQAKKDDQPDIVIHLIGDGEELPKYKRMVVELGLEGKVVIHGYLSGQKLNEVYNNSDIALDSLGRHRSKIYYNSSLKGKEYCAKGLPIISGVETEFDSVTDFNYYFRVPANDSPVKMSDIVSFYDSIYNSGKSRNEIVDEISNYAKEHFSYSKALSGVESFVRKIS